VPAGALAASAGGGELATRVTRLLAPAPPLPWVARALVCLAAAVLAVAPVVLLFYPL
jgi:hypothetical protein